MLSTIASQEQMTSLRFFSERWEARIPFQKLFWRDLLVFGTGVNVLVTFVGLMLIAQGYPPYWAVITHLLVLPYNMFLVLAVLRWPNVRTTFKVAAGGWLLLTSVA